jgi:seryl-tRNA synthetase
MLEIQLLRAQPDFVKERLRHKNFAEAELVDKILATDEARRAIQIRLDAIRSQENALAKEIGGLFKEGKKDEAETKKQESIALKEESAQLTLQFAALEKEQNDLLVILPNLPSATVPAGKVAEDNEVVKQAGEIPTLYEGALPHWELAKKYDLFDLELGVKITGAGFPVFKGKGAKLQRALIAFFLDKATEAGYLEITPPLMVNEASAFATGQLPDKEGQMYHATVDNLFLIPTAEVPVTNIVRDEIFELKQLPIKMTAFSPCFRREAGSYGKDVRGLNRVHQFDKVEIVQIQHPEKSYEALNEMCAHVEGLLQALELPYRILRLCAGDMSFASALTFDFEVYSTAQERWLEVSSVSNFETFQTNRLKTRYRDENKKLQFCHSLNGSALALPRILAGILENHQTPDGIKIPKALQPYFGAEMLG